ncbi:MAG: M48 family metallopeptidase [bacterium]|nr:M48 family metallopeptidase [bacterium]
MVESVYPLSPVGVPEDLTKPTGAQRRNVWLAVFGLFGFVAVYLGLTGWFAYSAYLGFTAPREAMNLASIGISVGSTFLTVFLLKALFFVKKGEVEQEFEVKPEDEPQLFEFLHRLADETGAPRPHRVFLSPTVNAAVFYDLTFLNFILPSRKNLDVGLGLINVLTLSEFKAVLAHEFGHFAQRSMALGNWVYIAQQIAAHIIARRDALDEILRFISGVDLRVAWIGWLLRLIVWSLRSALESVFDLVLIAQRALSREMEFQADRVSVSVTGSEALIHALHKLQAADDAWDRAQSFVAGEVQSGRAVQDVFTVQLRILDRMRGILNDPDYGRVPEARGDRQDHRVFTAELAQPPRMWATHPYNHEREENAKSTFVSVDFDEREGWLVFAEPEKQRARMSKILVERMKAGLERSGELETPAIDETLTQLDRQFARAYMNSRYRGAYLGRSFVRHAEQPHMLYEKDSEAISDAMEQLYPESLGDQIEQMRRLERERDLLQALIDRTYTAPDGVLRFRGSEVARKDLPELHAGVKAELGEVQEAVFAHDRRCRTAHRQAAARVGNGWEEYLTGLLGVVHYADHQAAGIRDAQNAFINVFAVVTADGHVSSSELKRLIDAARGVYWTLEAVSIRAKRVLLDDVLRERLGIESWEQALGSFRLDPPSQENIDDWIGVVDSWIEHILGALDALDSAATDELLEVEARVAEFAAKGAGQAPQAPGPSEMPNDYPTLLPGNERPLQKRLGWWDRFQTADGPGAGLLRFSVAALILGGAFLLTIRLH